MTLTTPLPDPDAEINPDPEPPPSTHRARWYNTPRITQRTITMRIDIDNIAPQFCQHEMLSNMLALVPECQGVTIDVSEHVHVIREYDNEPF